MASVRGKGDGVRIRPGDWVVLTAQVAPLLKEFTAEYLKKHPRGWSPGTNTTKHYSPEEYLGFVANIPPGTVRDIIASRRQYTNFDYADRLLAVIGETYRLFNEIEVFTWKNPPKELQSVSS